MKIKKWILVVCSMLASMILVACQSSTDSSQSAVEAIKQKGKLVVATSPDYAPFEFQALVDGKTKWLVLILIWLKRLRMNLELNLKSLA